WGGGIGWNRGNIIANRPVNINNIGNNWQHNAAHRRGVAYNNRNVQQRFGSNNARRAGQNGMDFRGRNGQQVLRPGNDKSGANRSGERRSGARDGGQNRSASDRSANRG